LAVHHKDRNRDNNSENNIITLCGICHAKLHWKEGKLPKPKNNSVCKIDGCDKIAIKTTGYCRNHHLHLINNGDPLRLVKRRNQNHDCVITGCLNHAMCRGLCEKHYAQYRRGNRSVVPAW
jgi:hypothetical protein